MREIKFRAWDTDKKIMIYDGDYSHKSEHRKGYMEYWYYKLIEHNGEIHKAAISMNNGVHHADIYWETIFADSLMQYTGLKDKNGKEIYEGDILKEPDCVYNGTCAERTYLVSWNEDRFCFDIKSKITDGSWNPARYVSCSFARQLLKMEVIGNIYENPELLNQPKNGAENPA